MDFALTKYCYWVPRLLAKVWNIHILSHLLAPIGQPTCWQFENLLYSILHKTLPNTPKIKFLIKIIRTNINVRIECRKLTLLDYQISLKFCTNALSNHLLMFSGKQDMLISHPLWSDFSRYSARLHSTRSSYIVH